MPDEAEAAASEVEMQDRSPEQRLEAFMAALSRADATEVQLLAAQPLDPGAHAAARETALEAARFAGRSGLVTGSRTMAIEWVERNLGAATYQQAFLGAAAPFVVLRPEERVHLARVLEDAALACVVFDRVDEAVADELLGPCAGLLDEESGGAGRASQGSDADPG